VYDDYLINAQKNILSFIVVPDDPGLHLALVVGHEHDLPGLEVDRADALEPRPDDVRLQKLHHPPGAGV